jgi:hypothetical protein
MRLQIKDGSDVAELMEVFTVDNAYNNKFPRTSEAKHRYKETEGARCLLDIGLRGPQRSEERIRYYV